MSTALTGAFACTLLGAWLLVAALACGAMSVRHNHSRRRAWDDAGDACLAFAAWVAFAGLAWYTCAFVAWAVR